MVLEDEGRIASRYAYMKVEKIRDEIKDALIMMRSVDVNNTIYRENVPNLIGRLEMLEVLAHRVVADLGNMGWSNDWLGLKPQEE